MSTPASIRGHPLHAMLIPLPIGLWVFSLVCDIIDRTASGGPVWGDVAICTMIGGTIGALLAALPGFIDLTALEHRKTKSIALWHMSLNLLAVVTFAINIWLRMAAAPDMQMAFGLSVLGIVLIGISGWLGGELVYRRGVGVQRLAD